MICAGALSTEDTGTCVVADAGSPLVTQDGLLVGIVSAGSGRCGPPGIYSRVSWASLWMALVVCEFSIFPPLFCDEAPSGVTSKKNGSEYSLVNAYENSERVHNAPRDSSPFKSYQNRESSVSPSERHYAQQKVDA
jgi:secreted trypsin-like serine protease